MHEEVATGAEQYDGTDAEDAAAPPWESMSPDRGRGPADELWPR